MPSRTYVRKYLPNPKFASVPVPTTDPKNLRVCVEALKMNMELLATGKEAQANLSRIDELLSNLETRIKKLERAVNGESP